MGYALGPKVPEVKYTPSKFEFPASLAKLQEWIAQRESQFPNLKPDNESRIIWADSIPSKTDYSIVYLHGWSASYREGAPVHQNIAKRFGMNLYLPRLAGHGLLQAEPMLDLTADALLQSADEAIGIGKLIGKKVIVMSTSTGGTLALALAQYHPEIAGIILYSPNVQIYDSNAPLLAKPWGLQLARWIKGGDYHEFEEVTQFNNQYWTTKYRLEALTQLQSLVSSTMHEDTFKTINIPTFLGYYYMNDSLQDKTVSVQAMREMFSSINTPRSLKMSQAFPNAGDHVIACDSTSQSYQEVENATVYFIEKVLKIRSY